MAKVLRIVNRFNIGGPTYNAAYLTKYLSPNYKTVLVGGSIDSTEDSSEYILSQLGIKPIIIPEMQRTVKYNNDFIAYYKIKEIIKRFKPDIVHTHASKSGALGRWAAYRSGVPVIIHTFHGHVFHSYFNKINTEIVKRVERKLASVSTKIVTLSDIQKYEISVEHKICDPDKISVIPLGFDLSCFNDNSASKRINFRKTYQLSDDEIAIGIVGRLVPIKNHHFFIEAFQMAKSRTNKKIRAFIVGDGELKKQLIEYCQELGLSVSMPGDTHPADITFTSWIKNVDEVYAGMDLIALTSLNEGTPVTLIEAQASGRPVVSSNVGGIENVIRHGETGLLVHELGPSYFADNLLELIDNDEYRHYLGSKGWNHVQQRFHYSRLVNDIDQLYQEQLKLKNIHGKRIFSRK
jgi:glycosyltransferase involved in cell wall biosynthesis